MPSPTNSRGTRVIACAAPFGKAGLGQHFAQLVEESRSEGLLEAYYCPLPKAGDERGRCVPVSAFGYLSKYSPLRFSPSWKNGAFGEYFDTRVALSLNAPANWYMGFVGKSLRSFRRAAALGFDGLELVAANSHVDNVMRLHAIARAQSGIRDSWLNEAQRRKTLREYEMADRIYVHSEYTRRSFEQAGVASSRIVKTTLRVNPRFTPPTHKPGDGVFRVAYVGRVEATKGIHLLFESFNRLSARRAKLTVVGGVSSRTMRRYVEAQVSRNPSISVAPGDPLEVLHQADVFVNPSYEDGFAYAPMEALACGVPVIVSEDTGMKEYVREGVNGYVVPTGRWDAILERLEHIRKYSLRRTCADGSYLMDPPSSTAGRGTFELDSTADEK